MGLLSVDSEVSLFNMHYQVLLSEIYTDPGGARVVVKELKANASAKEQNDFLQQGDPYR